MDEYEASVIGSERFREHRKYSPPSRRDGSFYSEQTDRLALGAQKYGLDEIGSGDTFDPSFSPSGSRGKSHGWVPDPIDGQRRSVNIRHLGVRSNGTPRGWEANLIITPGEPSRFADIYVVVGGTVEAGFDIFGWIRHEDIIKRPLRAFNDAYGLRYWCPVADLNRGMLGTWRGSPPSDEIPWLRL